MGCTCSKSSTGPNAITILVIGLDNSGKTTLSRTINGGKLFTKKGVKKCTEINSSCWYSIIISQNIHGTIFLRSYKLLFIHVIL